LIIVPVSLSINIETELKHAIGLAEQKLKSHGRVLLRPSGTEPLIRVMVEGEDASLVNSLAQELAHAIEVL
jgi:phosphoglucosamine mutase